MEMCPVHGTKVKYLGTYGGGRGSVVTYQCGCEYYDPPIGDGGDDELDAREQE